MPQKSQPDDATQVAQYMTELHHPMKGSIETLRNMILSIHPDIKERIKWNAPSYHFKGVDFLTFGPPARKQNEILLVFHHPEIVNISSKLLEGKYPDRRLIVYKNEEAIALQEAETKSIIEQLLLRI